MSDSLRPEELGRLGDSRLAFASVGAGPRGDSMRTGLWWALGLSNPLVRLEWVGWRRRSPQRLLAGLLLLGALGALFVARYGTQNQPGYSATLGQVVAGTSSLRAPVAAGSPFRPPSEFRRFLASVAAGSEATFLRLTTILPWLLVVYGVWRVRRSGQWESLRLTALARRDWLAGLAGPPVVMSSLALGVFLAAVVFPSLRVRYPPGTGQFTGAAATLPFIAYEGFGNIVLVSGVTLIECLRSRRMDMILMRTLGWLVGLAIAQSVFHYVLYRVVGPEVVFDWIRPLLRGHGRGPVVVYTMLQSGLPLGIMGTIKLVVSFFLLRHVHGSFWRRMQAEAELHG